MSNLKGTLHRWNDDKGFGFIHPYDSPLGTVMAVLLLLGVAGAAYKALDSSSPRGVNNSRSLPLAGHASTARARFSCAGKTHCSEMTSCDEARFYLDNCPGTKMDGDGDGIPCEQQWCR